MGNQGFMIDIGNKFRQNLNSHSSLSNSIITRLFCQLIVMYKKLCYDKITLAGMGVGLLTNQKIIAGAHFRIEPTCIIITLVKTLEFVSLRFIRTLRYFRLRLSISNKNKLHLQVYSSGNQYIYFNFV